MLQIQETPHKVQKKIVTEWQPSIGNVGTHFQASQAVPNLLGVSIAGYINMGWGGKVSQKYATVCNGQKSSHFCQLFQAGYYFSAVCVLIGSATLSLIDLHRWIVVWSDGWIAGWFLGFDDALVGWLFDNNELGLDG